MKGIPGKGTLILGQVVIVAVLFGCGWAGEGETGEEVLRVAVSIQPQAWLVEQVGGERVEVISLLSPGDSPATYQPADAQISSVIRAAVYFRIGVPFENGQWFEALMTAGGPEVADLRQGIDLRRMAHEHEHEPGEEPEEEPGGESGRAGEAGAADPHIWLSPRLLRLQATTVAEALSRIDPEHAGEYRANLDRLEETLDALDSYIRQRLDALRGRSFYVFHPAWGYFADEYGLHQEAIEIEGKDPSDHELTRIQTRARQEGIRVIFVQPQIGGKAVEAVARAIGAEVKVLDPLVRDVDANLKRAADAIAEALR